ncbi:MAG: DUF4874 domain-containing protein [Clostridiales bacterium]|nr:DUF4874 domain-containing protein [Clostridiales bacterium]
MPAYKKIRILSAVVLFPLVFVPFTAALIKQNRSPVIWDDDAYFLPSIAAESVSGAEFAPARDDFLRADEASALLQNPDRGLRLETYITLSDTTPEAYPGGGKDPYAAALKEIEAYKEDSPALAQVYVYLTNYNAKKKIGAEAFAQMKRFFELFESRNIRILLRFAYANDGSPGDAAYKYVSAHLDQIGAWFKDNARLTADTVYAVQAGLVGYWGEGHTYSRLKAHFIGDAFRKLMDITPSRLYVQFRQDSLAARLNANYLKTGRVALHDDYVIGDINHAWGFFTGTTSAVTPEAIKYTVNDAEMPWGRAFYNDDPAQRPLNALDGKAVISQLVYYHTTSLSLKHNYREDGERQPYSMERWRSEYVTRAELDGLNAPYNPYFFESSDGSDGGARMSVYDYLRYHLGYNLVLSNVGVSDGRLNFTVTNFGMAAPLNFNTLSLVAEKNGVVKEFKIACYDKAELQPNASVSFSVDVSCVAAGSGLGLKLAIKNGSDITARFANRLLYENGVHRIAVL